MNLSFTYNTTNIAICTMLHSSLFLMAGLGLAAAAPGPYGAVQAPAPVPARQTAGVQCRTEYTAVWDTEYVERETQECVTKYVPECKTVFERQCQPTTRQVVSKDDLVNDLSNRLTKSPNLTLCSFIKLSIFSARPCMRRSAPQCT